MTWIKFESTTHDKQEVWQIASTLGIDPDAVVGKLLRVWVWFDMQTKDGNAASVTKSLLDRCVGVTGFCDSMISVGWMNESDGVISLPNFDRHNGQTAKNRALGAIRAQKSRSRNASTVTPSLPEKRREDKNNTYIPTEENSEVSKTDPRIDPKLAPHWQRYCDWIWAMTGTKIDKIREEMLLMDLERRGVDKAIKDIEYTILSNYDKKILDSNDDFSKQRAAQRQQREGPKFKGRTTEQLLEEAFGPRQPEAKNERE